MTNQNLSLGNVLETVLSHLKNTINFTPYRVLHLIPVRLVLSHDFTTPAPQSAVDSPTVRSRHFYLRLGYPEGPFDKIILE